MIELAMALQRLGFLNSRDQGLLLDVLGSIEDLRTLTARDLLQIAGRPYKGQSFDSERLICLVRRDLDSFPSMGIQTVFIWSDEYPALLREIPDPPILLYLRGRIPRIPCVSVVGTRKPTTEGRHAAYRTGFELSRLGYAVISGLALGIDAQAHLGAVEAGGESLAVLGTGIDNISPRFNRHIAARMIEQEGGIISEFPPGTPGSKYRFPQRNRIIAGLSPLTILVEAPRGSGALITAEFAYEQSEVMVHRSGCESILGDGCRELASNGARVFDRISDVLLPVHVLEDAHER